MQLLPKYNANYRLNMGVSNLRHFLKTSRKFYNEVEMAIKEDFEQDIHKVIHSIIIIYFKIFSVFVMRNETPKQQNPWRSFN